MNHPRLTVKDGYNARFLRYLEEQGEACFNRMSGTALKVLTAHPTPSPACLGPSDVDSDADTPSGEERPRDVPSRNRGRSESGQRGSAVQPIGRGSDGTDGRMMDALSRLVVKSRRERGTTHLEPQGAHSDSEGVPSPKSLGTPPNPGKDRSAKRKRSRAPSPPSSHHSGSDSEPEPPKKVRGKSGTKRDDSLARPKSRRENLLGDAREPVRAVVDEVDADRYSERSYKSSSKKGRKNRIDTVVG